jgi:hypothetical protein
VLSVPAALCGKPIACPHPGCGKPLTVRPPAAPPQSLTPERPPLVAAQPAPRAKAAAAPHAGSGWRPWLIVAGVGGVGCLFLVIVLVVGAVAFLGFSTSKETPTPVATTSDPVAADAPAPEPAVPNPAVPNPAAPGDRARPNPRPDAEQPPVIEPVRADLELPPVGPTRAAAGDQVAQEFKAARAACADARKKARAEIRVQLTARKAQIDKNDTKALPAYNAQFMAYAYAPGSMEDTGPLPTHPLMQTAVADYWKAMDDATRRLGEAAEKALVAYEKTGITDPAKQRPLQAARLAGQNAGLLGIWGTNPGGFYSDVWIVDVDEGTGGLRLDGLLNYNKGSGGHHRHAEDVQFADGKFSFKDCSVDMRSRKVAGAGTPASLRLQDGKLIYEGVDGRNKPITKTLHRTGLEAARASIDYWGVPKATPAESNAPVEKEDPNDANFVWRKLATFSSFPAYRGKFGPAGGEQLYIPIRSSRPTLSRNPYAGLGDMLLGRAPGAGQNQQLAEALFREFDQMGETPHSYLRRAVGEFLSLSRARIQLAEADELMGNTPNSSIREFQQKVFLPAGRYVFQREMDRLELQDQLQREHPDKEVIVLDAPRSAESRQRLKELLDGMGGMMEDVKKRAVVSGLLAYADMAQVDRASALWQTWLLPLAKRCGGPASPKPLVKIEGNWHLPFAQANRRQFNQLKDFQLKNVSGQDLTHVAVEMIADNEWGEKVAQYYYFPRLDVAEVARLVPHPRWEKRRLPFTNTINVKWSVWADQGSEVDRHTKLTNPVPNPDPAGWRKDYLKFDKQYQAQGEALGAIVRNFKFLPIQPQRQRRRLLELAAPGSSYAIQLTDRGKPFVVRFLRRDAEKGAVELEVIDLASRKPFRPGAPVWHGDLKADSEAGYVIHLDAGWTLLLAQDDHPTLSIPKSDESPARSLPLVRIKLR